MVHARLEPAGPRAPSRSPLIRPSWAVALVALLALACNKVAPSAPEAERAPPASPVAQRPTPPKGGHFLVGSLAVVGSAAPPTPVLAAVAPGPGHPYVRLRTRDGLKFTLYEAPTTGRLTWTVPAAFLRRVGVADASEDRHYGSYVPLKDVSLVVDPPDALSHLPMTSLRVDRLPVAKMSGPGSSRGDRPEDALLHVRLELRTPASNELDPSHARWWAW